MPCPNRIQTHMNTTLIDFIQNELIADPDLLVRADDDLMGLGMLSSMQFMRLIQFVESRWQIAVPPEDMILEHFQNVNLIADYLSMRTQES